MVSSYSLSLGLIFCVPFPFFCKEKILCLILCLGVHRCVLPGKGIPEMIFTVSGGTLNPTRSLSELYMLLTSNAFYNT